LNNVDEETLDIKDDGDHYRYHHHRHLAAFETITCTQEQLLLS
jgi:hypothetical protein